MHFIQQFVCFIYNFKIYRLCEPQFVFLPQFTQILRVGLEEGDLGQLFPWVASNSSHTESDSCHTKCVLRSFYSYHSP